MQAMKAVREWDCRGRVLRFQHPVVMAIVNVTPDSFFAGSRSAAPAEAVARGKAFYAAGAQILDIGGESTRPGADAVDPEDEIGRVVPVIRGLRQACPEAFLSVDTRHPEVAAAALEAGADILNQVEGCSAPLAMAGLLRTSGAGYVLMHSRGTPKTMDALAGYDDVVSEVIADLLAAAGTVIAAGVSPRQIVLDPGLGFAKSAEDSQRLLKGTGRLAALPYPCIIGASRKRFLGGDSAESRLEASLAAAEEAVRLGASAVRVHDVAETVARLNRFQG